MTFPLALTRKVPWLVFPELLWRRRQGAEAIRDFQNSRLQQLVHHAFTRVPFYREQLAELSFSLESFRGLEDLRGIPETPKAALATRDHAELLSDGFSAGRLLLHCTSGSSGRPLRVCRSWHEERMLELLRLTALSYYGWNPSFKRATLTSMGTRHGNLPQQLLSRIGYFRVDRFDCFAPCQEQIAALADCEPDILGGYPESVAALSRAYIDIDDKRINPKFLTVGGGLLTPLARAQIEACFPRAPVYDLYGATEFNLVAWECPSTGLFHTCDDGVILEVLDEEGKPVPEGAPGRLVGTSLHSFAMPLLRFPLGDIVVRGPSLCPCGAPFGTLEKIQGRHSEILTVAGDIEIHPFEILDPLDSLAVHWLQRYRLIQKAPDLLVVELVAEPRPCEQETRELQRLLAAPLDSRTRLEIEYVADMPQEASGKFALTVPLRED